MTADLIRLRAEVRADRETLGARLDQLDALDLEGAGEERLALAAVCLHHAYGALESLVERVLRAFDGQPTGADWG